jgi:predicted O-linked N-acetylglucosamine transferase (SPINDLY family)
MSTVDETLAIGTRHHQAGQLALAEQAYRQVLSVEPNHPHALHQLGMLAMQARRFDAAVELFTQALRGERAQPAFHANLGEAYRMSGKPEMALECYRRALKLQPRLAPVQRSLGNLLHEQGKLDEAAAALRDALRMLPDDVPARARLGRVLEDQKKFADAEICFRRVLRSEPQSAEAHFNLASSLRGQSRLEEAAASYRTALSLKPDFAEAHNNLGTILRDLKQLDEAAEHFRAAMRLKPDNSAAYINFALLESDRNRLDEAVALLAKALEIDPDSLVARHSLGTVLQKQGKIPEAATCFQEVLRRDPNHAPSHLSLGYLYSRVRDSEKAIARCQEALRLDPDNPEAYNNMGVAWAADGHHDEAIADLRRALELRPDFAMAHSNLAISLQSLGLLDEALEHHRRAISLGDAGAGPHSNLLYALNYHPASTPETLFAEHRAWAERWADPLTAASPPHSNDRAPDRWLRLGYVSPHFRAHAVNFFVEPILHCHDPAKFETFCYSDVEHEDETTARLRSYVLHWRETQNLSDEQLAEQVRADKIDILVDLTGHIHGGRRMLMFARKPAPIQVAYIGYQNTTGMRAMDYRLTDAYSDPPGVTDRWHTEKLARLPRLFYCYLPSPDAPRVERSPALTAGHVTFGSVNSFMKVNQDVLKTWAEILLRVTRSRLILRADMTASLRQRLLETFAALGVEADRLELVNRLPRAQYLELIQRMDIHLDPFPFDGHTTTCDCLWQGVPVVTLTGQSYVSRYGASGIAAMGLDELIAESRDAYVDIAVALAGDLARLEGLRSTLRDRMGASPIVDFGGFTANLEAEYQRMWRDWAAASHQG